MRKHGGVDNHNSRAFSLRIKKNRAKDKIAKTSRKRNRSK